MQNCNEMEFTEAESILLETLVMATSQEVSAIKSAEAKLLQWEKQPGYYSTLLKIFSNQTIDPTVRWLAVSIFKNGVDKYWRKAADNAILETEKVSLRSGLVNTFIEPVHAVAVQLSALVLRIARYDCPKEWPELIPHLEKMIKSEDSLIQSRGLLILNQVIKALASKRLPGDKRVFQLITADIFSFVLNCWTTLFQVFFSQVQNSDFICVETLAKVLLAVKILKKLTIHGFQKPHESQDVLFFLDSIFERIKDMFLICKLNGKAYELTKLSEKVISHMTIVLPALLEHHPYSFVPFIQPSLCFIFNVVFSKPTDVLFEKFIVQCLNLMKAIIMCQEYKRIKFADNSYTENNINQHEVAQEACRIKGEFFKPEILTEICTKLITCYFLLSMEDLLSWEEDPENFVATIDDMGESWKFCLHSCTHSLYLALLHEYREVLTPSVLTLVREHQPILNPQDLNGILKKDAVYTSIGLCAFDFYDEIDFDQWFTSTLMHELTIKEPNYRIIRRRVAWLIGKWTDVNTKIRPAICNAIIPLLRREEDMVVRLTAAIALKSIVDSLEFTTEEYAKFLGPSFSMLFDLLRDVTECSTKMQVLGVLSYIVEGVGEAVKPYAQSLIQYLPVLWQESAEHNMLKCVIVSTLVQFVKALVSENLTKFLYQVIECCIDFNNDDHVYLMEDGLELWLAVIEYSSFLTPELFNLYKNMSPILENTLEHMECCCNIIQAYILLQPEKFLTEYGESLITLCSSLLTDVDGNGIVKIMQVIETAIKANPQIGVNVSLPMLVYIVLGLCEDESWTMVKSMYLTVISRTVLFSTDVFSQVLEKAGDVKSCSVESILEQVLIVWNKVMPLVTQLEKRKLLALALTSLLTVQSTVVMAQFSAIAKNIVEALNDIMDIDNLSSELNSLMLAEDKSLLSDDVINDSSKMEVRKQQLNEFDPVYKIELKGFLQTQFNELKNQMGVSNFESLLQTLEPEVLQQCRMYVSF